MKVLVVLCAVVAGCLAKPYDFVAPVAAPFSYSSLVSVARPYAYGHAYAPAAVLPAAGVAPTHAVTYTAHAPAVVAAPAPVAYAAPAVVHAAPAPVVHAAPAPLVHAAPAPVVHAAPVAYAAPAAVHAAPVAVGKTQYHAQNELGEASYGHAEPGQTHNAVQDAHGNKIGSFSYVNPEGQVLRTDYVADGAGYRVASNALPAAPIVTPIDTPEVIAARAAFQHEYASRAAGHLLRRRRSAVLVQTPASTAPLAYPAPFAYAAPAVAPVAYAAPAVAPVAYAAPAVAPVAYSAPALSYTSHASVAYPAPAVAPVAYSAPAPLAYSGAHALPASRHATLTTVVNNPGHAVSYRVD